MKDQESSCHKEIAVRGGKENIEVTLGGKKQTESKTKRTCRDFEVEKSRAKEREKKGDGCN